MLFESFVAYPQQLLLDAVGIGAYSALKHGGGTRHLRQALGNKSAGAAFRRRGLEPKFGELFDRGGLQIPDIHSIDHIAEDSADFFHHWLSHRVCGLLIRGACRHAQHDLPVLSIRRDSRV